MLDLNSFKIGDEIILSDFYISNYPFWSEKNKNTKATIKKISRRKIAESSLDKETKSMYRSLYGLQEEYDIIGLYIKYPDENKYYIVSPFGVKKV